MLDWIQYQNIQCPYCAEYFEIEIDTSAGADVYELNAGSAADTLQDHQYIEDCYVCCRPIKIMIAQDPESGQVSTKVKRLDE
ncbi:CPXCG motif-containing cysteine-rich protein [bacterium]|nr:CPXCG motif-containing cysteine-rich protein [bacterium]